MTQTYSVNVDSIGNVFWYNEAGQLHRVGGLPAIENANGNKEWWVNGQRHREGGLPACEWVRGSKFWYVNGKPHRDGGLPAFEYADGEKQWYVNGIEATEEQAKHTDSKCNLSNKIIEIDGKKFKLVEV